MFSVSMEENPAISMGKAGKITRKSVHTFLQYYQYFTTIATLIMLPFSISVLISQSIISSSFNLLPSIYNHLLSLFFAAGFPSSHFFSLISLKLSQTILSSIVTLPFSLSFLLLAKSSIIHFFTQKIDHNGHQSSISHNVRIQKEEVTDRSYSNSLERESKKNGHSQENTQKIDHNHNHKSSSFINHYSPILSTHICNTFIIFGANATCFSLLFLAFNFLEGFYLDSPKWVLFFSCIGAIFYSIILANALVVCNLALVSSGIERKGGLLSIVQACVLIRGKTSTALALAVPVNLGLAAVEALFHYRIVANSMKQNSYTLWLVALEGMLIAYIYAMILVLDVIMSCMFYQSCKEGYHHGKNDHDLDHGCVMEVENYCYYDYNVTKLNVVEEFV
ncbi:uncharacterized protein LOC130798638 [Amaranthus tricolor]|uniref:uncharacterized protein LOC130798638 n=1 Tax=Amaranthus tricolor TaxID=29722 RepID=UPI00258F2AF7|nr:uncharacterized protein LOC130798638 [Amaranthus tricolor]